ncbi:MAG TPA: SPFH domain-containing protein [Anaerolineales bacterium]|nr:SPFH domain-containing protein [Anaerolineales bacterium]HMZ43671.1 SPFH domain-containing protein [Anaerolineales bacterium]HNA55277.1 SPFH domain-containing protein [Anaerolineales bacterium]HNC89810.1 SPFH domain-containing protein [Anaerolineales bacterium]HND91739.1 SPFH domain-containing protein [Anaerolineales bacterium]
MMIFRSAKTRVSRILQNLLVGDLIWARLRGLFLLFATAAVSVFIAAGFSADKLTLLRIWNDIAFPMIWLAASILLSAYILVERYEEERAKPLKQVWYVIVFAIFIGPLSWFEFVYVRPLLTGEPISRFLILPLAALISAFLSGARYVQDVFNIKHYVLAVLYLLSSFCGIKYPKIKISENYVVGDGKNRIDQIGGPGYVFIGPGNAILTERLHGPAGVYSAGRFFLSRFETIVSTLNLDDQHGLIPAISAVTKDGIMVTVKDVQFRYRVWSGHREINTAAGRSLTNPYPFTVQAIRNLTYNRTVSKSGPNTWHDMVKGVISGAVSDYITKHQLDQITAPRYTDGDARKEISAQLKTSSTRDKLKDAGAQLLWCDIGHFEVDNKAVSEQRIDTWKAGWMGNADVKRAYGEAQRNAYQEIGHAEAQAEILMSIVHAFDDIDLAKEDKDRSIRNIILMRTAQVLEALSVSEGSEQNTDKNAKKDGKKP